MEKSVRRRGTAEQTRGEILSCAAAMFASQGYEATSLAGLAQTLRISPATIHKYFGSKQALAEQVCRLQLGRFLDHIRAASQARGSFADRLREVADALATYHWRAADTDLWSTDLYVSAYQSEWTVFRQFRADVVALLGNLLDEGVAAGELRDDAADEAVPVHDALEIFMHPLALRDVTARQASARALRVADLIHRALARS